jgi:hypothetical protein
MSKLPEVLDALESLAAKLVQDHRGIPYDVIREIDAIVEEGRSSPELDAALLSKAYWNATAIVKEAAQHGTSESFWDVLAGEYARLTTPSPNGE